MKIKRGAMVTRREERNNTWQEEASQAIKNGPGTEKHKLLKWLNTKNAVHTYSIAIKNHQ